MGTFNHANFNDRKNASANAKAALLEKLRNRPAADDPAALAKQAERQAILDAREKRNAEREAARLEHDRELEAERAALAAAEAAAQAERERQLEADRVIAESEKAALEEARLQRAARIIADEAERKAARDARYAARKAKR